MLNKVACVYNPSAPVMRWEMESLWKLPGQLCGVYKSQVKGEGRHRGCPLMATRVPAFTHMSMRVSVPMHTTTTPATTATTTIKESIPPLLLKAESMLHGHEQHL